jgi:trans-aconitate 2-methyltransferase
LAWSATQYSKFEAERNRPVFDLLQRVLTDPVAKAADLGCGPGNSTEILRGCFPGATVIGIDNSPDMLAAARKRLPDIRFEQQDIATWRDPGPFDLILANASLQWVPDHGTLLQHLLGKLAPGGSLAVQVPDNLDEATHTLMRETVLGGPWSSRLSRAWESWDNRRQATWYYRTLVGAGAKVDLWRTTYFHRLDGGPGAIVEWFKGTALRPFLEPLTADEAKDFLADYQARLADAYPTMTDGSVLMPFPQLFFVATR